MPPQIPYELRDVSRGVIRKSAVNSALVPPNSVSHSTNFNYDTIIGSAVVRKGTTLVGSQIAANKAPLGLAEFVTGGQAINDIIAVFKGASNATLYYSSGSTFSASSLTTLDNSAKVRFAVLNGRCYLANGVDAFQYFSDPSSSFTSVSFTGTTPVTIKPTLLLTIKNRMLASGATATQRSRVYFSSIVDPTTSPGITWNTDATLGDWIDINPDDGDDVTALQQTSGLVLVFKRNFLYRLDAINKTVDLNGIFPYGTPSQEATVFCQGQVFFFTGTDIRVSNGGFPDQISRLGVQDFIDAISQSNWGSVTAGTDGLNVFFSIGTVTVGTGQFARTFTNCVLKFSTRDSSWSVHTYAQKPSFYIQYTDSTNGRKMRSADTGGNVQTVDVGTTDNTTPIYYDLETQEVEFGSRAHQKQVTNKLAVYMNYGTGADFQYKENDGDWKPTKLSLTKRVNVLESFNASGRFISFRLIGSTSTYQPVFEGITVEKVTDQGMVV